MVENHKHTGLDSPQLTGEALEKAPQEAITAASATPLSTGGAAVLSTSDQTVIDNMRTRINALELALQNLKLLR